VLSRAFAILDCFAEGGPEQTHGMIVRATGFSAATVHRLLAEMVEWGAVERTSWGRYRIGMRLWRLGSRAPQGRELRDLALPYLQDLLAVTHQVVHLVVLDGDRALYLERLEARPGVAVQSQVGRRLPLHATGPGKVLLAYGPPELLESVLDGDLERHASKTITDPAQLRRALATVRQTGFCISRDEMSEGVSSVAVPIRDGTERVIASMSVVMPSSTPNLSLLVAPIQVAARGLSRQIGLQRSTDV
jgi:DNA-binding IclR family transcriptional regulator